MFHSINQFASQIHDTVIFKMFYFIFIVKYNGLVLTVKWLNIYVISDNFWSAFLRFSRTFLGEKSTVSKYVR